MNRIRIRCVAPAPTAPPPGVPRYPALHRFPDLTDAEIVIVRDDGTEEVIPNVAAIRWWVEGADCAQAVVRFEGVEIEAEALVVEAPKAEPKKPLRAWCNGYEVVGAYDEDDAKAVYREIFGAVDDDEVEGDGWQVMPDDKPVLDEDGAPVSQTVGDVVREQGRNHLWSCKQ